MIQLHAFIHNGFLCIHTCQSILVKGLDRIFIITTVSLARCKMQLVCMKNNNIAAWTVFLFNIFWGVWVWNSVSYIIQTGFELIILLPQTPEYWDHNCTWLLLPLVKAEKAAQWLVASYELADTMKHSPVSSKSIGQQTDWNTFQNLWRNSLFIFSGCFQILHFFFCSGVVLMVMFRIL